MHTQCQMLSEHQTLQRCHRRLDSIWT
jgi:hypothetical protein